MEILKILLEYNRNIEEKITVNGNVQYEVPCINCNEKMSISKTRDFYHCFNCGATGSAKKLKFILNKSKQK